VSLLLAAIPCALFMLNLLVYRPLRQRSHVAPAMPVSVLIPARNEERNIAATLRAVLANRGCEFEVIVLDDHSNDRTPEMVTSFVAHDPRVRMESAPPLPPGWCGKQHASYTLAHLARFPLLVFIDADVRLAPDALIRLVQFMEQSKLALASGIPRQEVSSFSERLLIPLIHFILLGFLPMHGMRRTRWPSMSGGCGQLFVAERSAYRQCGGHARLRDSLHDGLKLPRVFRRAGFRTDLFDATDLATCRMYDTNRETWRGLGKNATEGLASPSLIFPMTALLIGGQVLPFTLLPFVAGHSVPAILAAVFAAGAALTPRLIATLAFRQPIGSALLHPFGVLALLGIQWWALFRHLLGKPAEWKGRQYQTASSIEPIKSL
jgi:hypothetical protein